MIVIGQDSRPACVTLSSMSNTRSRRATPGCIALMISASALVGGVPAQAAADPGVRAVVAAQPAPAPKGPRPGNGVVIVRRGGSGPGVLTVDNGSAQDAYVTLARDGRAVLTLYVHNNAKASAKRIANGTYDLFFSTGSGWNADLKVFTADIAASRFDETFPYAAKGNRYDEWTVTLQPVVGGTAPTSSVDPGAVPG